MDWVVGLIGVYLGEFGHGSGLAIITKFHEAIVVCYLITNEVISAFDVFRLC